MSDIYEDIRIVVQRHREQAAAEERAKIVAWLVDNHLTATAHYIKHKEYLK